MKFAIAILFAAALQSRGMDTSSQCSDAASRFAALSMLESGDNDRLVGRAGEISRYQIKQQYWIEGNPHDAGIALANAKGIMAVRSARFENLFHRLPTDFEFYVLWNAPADFFAGKKISKVVRDRAQRFVNLCAK